MCAENSCEVTNVIVSQNPAIMANTKLKLRIVFCRSMMKIAIKIVKRLQAAYPPLTPGEGLIHMYAVALKAHIAARFKF